jgi:hypothetical protein
MIGVKISADVVYNSPKSNSIGKRVLLVVEDT